MSNSAILFDHGLMDIMNELSISIISLDFLQNHGCGIARNEKKKDSQSYFSHALSFFLFLSLPLPFTDKY